MVTRELYECRNLVFVQVSHNDAVDLEYSWSLNNFFRLHFHRFMASLCKATHSADPLFLKASTDGQFLRIPLAARRKEVATDLGG